MEFVSAAVEQQYAALLAAGGSVLVGLDFDGTLAPIVADPAAAAIHPQAPAVLAELGPLAGTIAVITGRPAAQALALGRLEDLGAGLARVGGELVLLGQYGNQRWTSAEPQIVSAPPPPGLADLVAELPAILRDNRAADAWIEDKGLAVAVHTRRCAAPREVFDRLLPLLAAAARTHGLAVEPGRLVIEMRARGMDKGRALAGLVQERGSSAVVFVGDDLGDLPAFDVVARLRDEGVPGLAVCSGSAEQGQLLDHTDLVVEGPDGVLDFLRTLTADLRG